MAKSQLSRVQQRRVQEKHNKKLNKGNDHDSQGEFLAPEEGTVITRFGKVADVENSHGTVFRCNIRRTLAAIVTGDKVIWQQNREPLSNGVIEAVHPRVSELVRPDFYDGVKPVAANIDQIMIISSVIPELSLNIIDRYLVACEVTQIDPVIVLNKIDLLDDSQRAQIEPKLNYYRQLGYPVLFISCKNSQGLEGFKEALKNKTSILVGQSGVGKSSIIQQVLPNIANKVNIGDVSDLSGLGQHTTTATCLYHLPSGGDIIDSPGIREFGLWHLEQDRVIQGFVEFYDHLSYCKFRDCNHLTDPDCGLQHAVSQGKIASWRLENYHKILQTMREVKAKTNKVFR